MSTETSLKAKSGSFQSLGLDKALLNGLNRIGYKAPTPVQRKALPIALAGMDLVCMARTGSGKTCVFLVPMLHKLQSHQNGGVRGLVLSPTRELAAQTFKFAKDMSKFQDLRIVNIVGGDGIEDQFDALSTHPDIIIATPGRLMHHLREVNTFKLKLVKYLVFDEADRLFEMGFAEQLNEIVRECPQERQTLLFSATMPKILVQFSRAGLRDPQLVRLDTDSKMSEELRLSFFYVRSNEKLAALMYLVRTIIPQDQQTIIFTATRHHTDLIHSIMQRLGITSTVVYGTMDQDARSANLKSFRNGEASFMIVTDLAARGIDIPLLNNVINFHFPPSPKLFVHRCGRAARQGRIGFAFSLVEPEELGFMMDVHTFLGKEMQVRSPQHNEDDSCPDTYDLKNMKTRMCLTRKTISFADVLLTTTPSGIKKAKAAVKKDLIRTVHPLIQGCDGERCNSLLAEKAEFVRMLQTFRPAQTVFETGIGTGTCSTSAGNVNGGQLLRRAANKTKLDKGVEMMKALRNVTSHALERNRKSVTVLESDLNGQKDKDNDDVDEYSTIDEDGEEGEDRMDVDERHLVHDSSVGDNGFDDDASLFTTTSVVVRSGKGRISLTEKRRLKKRGLRGPDIQKIAIEKAKAKAEANTGTEGVVYVSSSSSATGSSASASFRDTKHYMAYGNENEQASFAEDSMQPQSGLRSSESAHLLESALLDVSPDEALDLNKKKRMMRWDAKKRKFVKQSLEEMASNKRLRSESGIVAGGQSKKTTKGEMYEKWKKKSHKEIGGEAAEDDHSFGPSRSSPSSGKLHTVPRFKMKNQQGVRDELRSAAEIRKLQKEKSNQKMKNTGKAKRTVLEARNRKAKNESKNSLASVVKRNLQAQGRNRKSKLIVRM
eukprot:gene22559-30824_t